MANPEMDGEVVAKAHKRSVRGYIVFAFAIALVLATAYLMREILLLLYVSALFAVVLSPGDPCLDETPCRELASRQGAGYLFPVVKHRGRGYPVFRFRPAPGAA
jgi:hypothetical protein